MVVYTAILNIFQVLVGNKTMSKKAVLKSDLLVKSWYSVQKITLMQPSENN